MKATTQQAGYHASHLCAKPLVVRVEKVRERELFVLVCVFSSIALAPTKRTCRQSIYTARFPFADFHETRAIHTPNAMYACDMNAVKAVEVHMLTYTYHTPWSGEHLATGEARSREHYYHAAVRCYDVAVSCFFRFMKEQTENRYLRRKQQYPTTIALVGNSFHPAPGLRSPRYL